VNLACVLAGRADGVDLGVGVLSMVVSTVLWAVAISLPFCSIAQPKQLLPVLNPSRVFSIANALNRQDS